MKIILIFIIANVFMFSQAFSQNPNNCYHITYCDLNKSRPYYYCEGGNVVVKCAKDPNEDHLPLIPLKVPGRVCTMSLIPDNPSIVQMRNKYGFPAVVFSNSYWDNTLSKAHNNWSCLCRYDQLPCSCYVIVEFSDVDGDFDDPYTQMAKATWEVDISTCKIDCSNAKIIINSTDKFTGRTGGFGTEKRFFYNEECVSGNTLLADLADDYFVFSLQELIEHELGHFWGLPDVTKKDASGKEVSACPPYKYISVMDGVSTDADYNKLRLPITNDDECQLKLLYCRNDPLVSYDEDNFELNEDNCNNYPNPFSEQTKIQFEINDSEKFVVIEIYNQFGDKLNNLTGGIYFPGKYSLTFDGCNHPSGVYYYRLMIDDILICTDKMILQK